MLLYRVPGDLLNAVGDQPAAKQHYRQAIAAAAPPRLWRDQGKRAEARDLLGPIYHWFTDRT